MQRERMNKKKSSQVHCISSHDHILMMASTSKHIPEIRLYKAWKGNNRFFCGGRLIFGPDVNSLFLTSFLIGAPALTFCIRMLVWIQKDDPIFNYTVLTSAFILTLLRNYPVFICFISTSTLLCIYIFALSWINLIRQPGRLWSTMSHDIISVILIIYSFVSIWFVGGLTIFHVYLMSTNQTTYENFRSRYDKKENPYKRGLLKNVKEVLFAKIPPSQLDLRAMVPEEDDGSEYESEYSSSIRYDNEKGGKLPKRVSPEKLNLDNIDISNEYKTAKDDASSELDPSFFSSQHRNDPL
ncbi:hypothetical protein BRARA_J02687 [Brassica rapa]|uniref:S-acyltransferase n=1 Tax=Brassica campestris TaxID=3711 RepID=A0A397XNU2_BRACM|nr:hypothetical protein BRARA_J02687 [Brassica rapa]